MPLQVDPEFHALIPPLADDERRQLEANLVRDGCREPLSVWGDIILDGHNRHEICERRGVIYATTEIDVADRVEAADWIDANQLGRRNLTPDDFRLLVGRRYNRTKKSHGGDRKSSGQNVHLKDKTAEALGTEHGVDERTVRRAGKFAEAVADVEATQPSVVAQGHDAVIAQAKKVAHVSHNSGENEWYTPPEIIEAARLAMGGIDCDPASSEVANKTVKATTFYSMADDGLEQVWGERVWMNPPYAQPLVAQFSEAIAAKCEAGEVVMACVLVNNATETRWFQRMLKVARAACFLLGRVRFIDPTGKPSGAPLQGQAILYFGPGRTDFAAAFIGLGEVVFCE